MINNRKEKKVVQNRYEFYKENPKNKMWKVNHYLIDDNKNIEIILGEVLYSFDKKKIYNLWRDYPYNFTPKEKEIFDKENTYWKNFFKNRR